LVAACAGSLLGPAACVSGEKIRADAEVIKHDVERARKSGAYKCAPRELALAEANLDFAMGEVSEGNSTRAQDHIRVAEDNAKKALVMSKDCGPKQVLIREHEAKPSPTVVKIAKVDTDGDGIPDDEDACPTVPGVPDPDPKKNGCPKDTDGDGIPDIVDACPTVPGVPDPDPKKNGCPPDRDGDGIPDDKDACPDVPGVPDPDPKKNGCPPDRDGDGIPDDKDACPDVPGVPDPDPKKNGCPKDSDGDGIPDDKDACPFEPGPPSDDPAQNGCPKKYKLVVVTKKQIQIKQQIKFAFNKATIQGKISFDILDEVAQALRDNPQIKKLRIEGHTDNVGGPDFNLKLSQRRADAVMAELVKRGIEPGRMEATGFGKTRPIASNSTEKGRAENRRTEFNILERE
jgi:OmpA-OmpF porin, OOP family